MSKFNEFKKQLKLNLEKPEMNHDEYKNRYNDLFNGPSTPPMCCDCYIYSNEYRVPENDWCTYCMGEFISYTTCFDCKDIIPLNTKYKGTEPRCRDCINISKRGREGRSGSNIKYVRAKYTVKSRDAYSKGGCKSKYVRVK